MIKCIWSNFTLNENYFRIDNWSAGARIVAAISEMLNIKLSEIRVDTHEIAFRVEPNPEKKTAYDVARAINDIRFKNNLQRRLGLIVVRAGVGNKVKIIIFNVLKSNKIK